VHQLIRVVLDVAWGSSPLPNLRGVLYVGVTHSQ